MDSTPNPNPTPQPQPQPQSLSIKASASKLPIKRKTPDSFFTVPNPKPNSSLIRTPKLKSTADGDDYGDDDVTPGGDSRPPPFKFHRIWTEPDEIRFLRGLLDCSPENLSFPRDLHVFYARFSNTMPQPYTKSQLSEKLRRLRKKFRVISSRLAKGLDKALLSPHDQALYELSEQLWHPDFSSTSPFGANNNSNKPKESNLVGVEVSFSPILPSVLVEKQTMSQDLNQNGVLNVVEIDNGGSDDGFVGGGLGGDGGEVKLSEVNVEFEDDVQEDEVVVPSELNGEIEEIVGKTLIDVFDESLKEVRTALVQQGLLYHGDRLSLVSSLNEDKAGSFERRWREQRVDELDVLARRLRLVLEHSLQKHQAGGAMVGY
ncbi:unnamed protein product [Ilex paraguariensis]|uniref:Glabrous enhancer-binding protein-like DBD domain-containing protein n=1 Tax=Ilex paraguariensis TaxID=185542 RepID=A0ABC8SGQ3_9AQUA